MTLYETINIDISTSCTAFIDTLPLTFFMSEPYLYTDNLYIFWRNLDTFYGRAPYLESAHLWLGENPLATGLSQRTNLQGKNPYFFVFHLTLNSPKFF